MRANAMSDLDSFLHDFIPEIIPCKRDRIVLEENARKDNRFSQALCKWDYLNDEIPL